MTLPDGLQNCFEKRKAKHSASYVQSVIEWYRVSLRGAVAVAIAVVLQPERVFNVLDCLAFSMGQSRRFVMCDEPTAGVMLLPRSPCTGVRGLGRPAPNGLQHARQHALQRLPVLWQDFLPAGDGKAKLWCEAW